MSVAIHVKHVLKKYGDKTVIPDLSLDVKECEFYTLLGPSGCGKTTLLRMIAGFNSIEDGDISFNEKRINEVPAHKRNIGMVFQNYAIFPHLTVRENVEYGLKLRGIPKQEMRKKADELLRQVKIESFADVLPSNLSGGQQQRVALARAIVISPDVLLMDEPLSNLDAKLRVEMREVIRETQKRIGITTVYVTHDQEEALAVSDRIAIMNAGVIQQIGTPVEVYSRPANIFVASFIGQTNLLRGTAEGRRIIYENGFEMEVPDMIPRKEKEEVIVSVRPEEFSLGAAGGIPSLVEHRTFLGKYAIYLLKPEAELLDEEHEHIEYSQDIGHATAIYGEGERLYLLPNPEKINVFSRNTRKSLMEGVRTGE